MPPKPIRNTNLINQIPITISSKVVPLNNNNASTITQKFSQDITKPVNTFLTSVSNNLMIIGAGIVGVIFIIFKKS